MRESVEVADFTHDGCCANELDATQRLQRGDCGCLRGALAQLSDLALEARDPLPKFLELVTVFRKNQRLRGFGPLELVKPIAMTFGPRPKARRCCDP